MCCVKLLLLTFSLVHLQSILAQSIRPDISANSEYKSDVEDVMQQVFAMTNESNLIIFNNTSNAENVKSERSSHLDFTVIRGNDGKLNISYNEASTERAINPKILKSRRPDIVFPDDDRLDGNTPVCQEKIKSFCTKVVNYPSEKINNILQNLGANFEAYFGDDVISETVSNITQRIDPGEETLCRSEEQLIHPKALIGEDGNFKIIVNNNKYKQGIRVEQCVFHNNDKRCQMTDSFPNGYVTECKQRYISRNLLTLNEDGSTIEKELFKVPSCCQCVVRNEH